MSYWWGAGLLILWMLFIIWVISHWNKQSRIWKINHKLQQREERGYYGVAKAA